MDRPRFRSGLLFRLIVVRVWEKAGKEGSGTSWQVISEWGFKWQMDAQRLVMTRRQKGV